MDEYFRIFDEEKKETGIASRDAVHQFGYWHETFHCWFVTQYEQEDFIYLQLRSDHKQDYPGLLDITAAGHLTAEERVQHGVREIKEEIGVEILFDDLEPLGVIEYCVVQEDFIDRELANVFLYKSGHRLDDFIVQREEVAGVALAKFEDFRELWAGERETLTIRGFRLDEEDNRVHYEELAGKDRFVPHEVAYYEEVIRKIADRL